MLKFLLIKSCFCLTFFIGFSLMQGCDRACDCRPNKEDLEIFVCKQSGPSARNRVFNLWGYCWKVPDDDGLPGCNYFSDDPSMVMKDKAGRLHLRIDSINGNWHSSAVETVDSVGYGTYTFDVKTNLKKLDKNAVLSLAAYVKKDDRENQQKVNVIGINLSKSFGDSTNMIHYDADNGRNDLRLNNYRIQNPGNDHRFVFKWTPDSLYFKADNRIKDYAKLTFKDNNRIPKSFSIEHIRINFWLYDKNIFDNQNEQCCGCPGKRGVGDPPSNGKPQEVVIRSVYYSPY